MHLCSSSCGSNLVLVLFVDATTIDLASLIPLGAQYWVGFTLKQFLFGPLLGALVDGRGASLWTERPGSGG